MPQPSPEDKNEYSDKVKQKQIIPFIKIKVIGSVFSSDTNISALRQKSQNNADYRLALGEVSYAVLSFQGLNKITVQCE